MYIVVTIFDYPRKQRLMTISLRPSAIGAQLLPLINPVDPEEVSLSRPSCQVSSPRWAGWLIVAAASLLTACGGGDSVADDTAAACRSQVNDTPDKLLGCVTLDGVRTHLTALSAVAQNNGGDRAIGTPGYAASVAYVQQALERVGYRVTLQPFSYRTFQSLAPGALAQTTPFAAPIENQVFNFSGSGSVTARVSAPVVTTGCTLADFAGFQSGHIALLQRGACDYLQKADTAVKAGAVGVVVYNNQADGMMMGNLSSLFMPEVSVVGVSQAAGEQLAARIPTGLVLALTTRTLRPWAMTHNVWADLPSPTPTPITLLGAHLDSVPGTAGMNDNGSGTAALLETALQMAKVRPLNTLRFAFWGGEEIGLLGSNHYVESLSAAQQQQIDLYLNFDMIASPNSVYFYGADTGMTPAGGATRRDATPTIQEVMTAVYRQRGVPFKREIDPGLSDHVAFGKAGIPYGWLFTGANKIKTAEEVAVWGGQAGVPMDPCYHQACDNLGNINTVALALNADAVAYAALHFAMNRLPR
jgi:Zn-dependent M28 family amino/carboxypeptidase